MECRFHSEDRVFVSDTFLFQNVVLVSERRFHVRMQFLFQNTAFYFQNAVYISEYRVSISECRSVFVFRWHLHGTVVCQWCSFSGKILFGKFSGNFLEKFPENFPKAEKYLKLIFFGNVNFVHRLLCSRLLQRCWYCYIAFIVYFICEDSGTSVITAAECRPTSNCFRHYCTLLI